MAITRLACLASLCNKNNNQKHNDTLHTHTGHTRRETHKDMQDTRGIPGPPKGLGVVIEITYKVASSKAARGEGGRCTGFLSGSTFAPSSLISPALPSSFFGGATLICRCIKYIIRGYNLPDTQPASRNSPAPPGTVGTVGAGCERRLGLNF